MATKKGSAPARQTGTIVGVPVTKILMLIGTQTTAIRGYYVNRTDYNHYFREGFRRGYEDSFNNRSQYGRFANGNPSMMDNILSQILNFQDIT